MTQLNNHNVGSLSAAVETPTYDRQAVTPGIVHIGVGGFHRAHQAMYVDALMNQGEALDWGIVGVGSCPATNACSRPSPHKTTFTPSWSSTLTVNISLG